MSWIGPVIIITLALALVLGCLSITRRDIVSVRPVSRKSAQWAIRVRYTPGLILRWRGHKPNEKVFLGSGFRWFEHGNTQRCDKDLSEWLNKQWLEHR